nr:unnamed protein product [Callosobruchus chinensis]CAH7728900.1 unnamed protein product [Callosobruchus chinensis]CAH7738408.1 unnamed protein product [Callosobruchus chinensis]CAH7746007.1 unnamed protein product [Callosobruchus chinensis]CAH7747715.1 unnamed protein product [Callosobruchus chinensis]
MSMRFWGCLSESKFKRTLD